MLKRSHYTNDIGPGGRRLQGSDTIATSAGIALTGAYIYNSLASGNRDAVEEESGEGEEKSDAQKSVAELVQELDPLN